MGTPFYSRSPNGRLYGYALASVWNTGIWLPDPDWALQQDPDVWEVVQRDPVIAHAILQRRHSVASIDPSVQPGDETSQAKRAAEVFEAAVGEIANWPQSRFLSSRAVLQGRSYAFVAGERRRLTLAGIEDDWWVPTAFEDIDRRRIQFVPIRAENPETGVVTYTTRVQMQRKTDSQWIDLSTEATERFISLTYDDEESRLGYGRGILGAVYFYHYAKGILLREGLAGVERWARGLPAVTIAKDRMASTDKTSEERRQAWLNTILNMSGQGGVVMEEGDEIDVKFPSGEGTRAVFEVAIPYLDRGVTQLILGSVLPTGGGGDVGSNARAEVEAESSQILVQHDRRIMDDAYGRTLTYLFWKHNVAQLARVGCLTAKRPKLRSVQESREDPREAAEVAEIVLRTGATLKRSEYYERVGWEQPAPGEDVISSPTVAPAMPGGGAPAFGSAGGSGGGGGGVGPGGSSVALPGEPQPSVLDLARARVAENVAQSVA